MSNKLFETNVSIDPAGVLYDIKGSDISTFVENYLAQKGIQAEYVGVLVGREGTKNPEVSVYLFMDQNSKFINSELKNVPPQLKNKIADANMNLTKELREALTPLCGRDIRFGKRNGSCYIKLNPFRVLALMLNCVPKESTVAIIQADAPRKNKDTLMRVAKMAQYQSYGKKDKSAKYLNAMEDIEDNYRD